MNVTSRAAPAGAGNWDDQALRRIEVCDKSVDHGAVDRAKKGVEMNCSKTDVEKFEKKMEESGHKDYKSKRSAGVLEYDREKKKEAGTKKHVLENREAQSAEQKKACQHWQQEYKDRHTDAVTARQNCMKSIGQPPPINSK